MKKLNLILDTQARTQRFKHRDVRTEMVPFEHVRMLSESFHKQADAIRTDPHLTGEGKTAALEKARAKTRAAISEWHEQRLKNIDANLLEERAALIADSTMPDPKRVDFMASQLLKHTPQDNAIFYNAATDAERRVMEAASAVVGRVPMITTSGKELKTLLDPEMVNEAIMARAEATNPVAAEKVRELTEVRAMQVTITGVALSEI
jgi:hypothetical protein